MGLPLFTFLRKCITNDLILKKVKLLRKTVIILHKARKVKI